MNFFNSHTVLHPWPKVLRRSSLNLPYKPREVWWRSWIKKLGLKSGQKVLEVGCGRGIFLDRLVGEIKVKTFGVDSAKLAIEEAKKESFCRHELRVADASKLPFENNGFDSVLSFDTLEHIKNQKQAVSEMARVLKPDGKIIIYTINSRQSFTWNKMVSKLGIDIYRGVDHNPKLFVDPKWLEATLKESGIKVLKIDYFDAFFTLMANETAMVFLSLWQKFFGWEKTEKFGRMMLVFLTGFSVLTTPLLRFLDLPWTIFGHSNGFLIIGEKK